VPENLYERSWHQRFERQTELHSLGVLESILWVDAKYFFWLDNKILYI
jgi:hypothetical protein